MRNQTLERPGVVFEPIETEDLARVFDDELEQSVIDMKRSIDAQQARLWLRIAELDKRQISRTCHELSTTQWLMRFCRMTAAEASGTLKTARALTHLPTISANAMTGSIVPNAVRLLAQARDRHPDEFARHEEVFADAATHLSIKDLKMAIEHWDQQVDYDQALEGVDDDAQVHEMFFNQTYQGRWDMQGRFGVAAGHIINTALRSHVEHTYLDSDDRRSRPQRLADAAIDIHQFWLDHNETAPTSGGEKPHITVVVPYDVLTGAARQLPQLDGHTVDPATLRRWACDAGVVRIILNGASQPIDVGRRTRTIPPALRRALEVRDGGCVWPGCDAPIAWCDAHHVTHWADGGATCLENTELLCRRHHTTTHRGEPRPREP